MVIVTQPTCMGRTSATAHLCSTKEEIGHIDVIAEVEANFYRIDKFGVKEMFRKKGAGRKLLGSMIEEVKRIGGSVIVVYPNPESYEEEELMDIETLYRIYEKLGFAAVDPNADYKRPNNKMIIHV